MAEKLGVSKSTVDRYRVGLIAPSYEVLVKMRKMGIPIDDIYF